MRYFILLLVAMVAVCACSPHQKRTAGDEETEAAAAAKASGELPLPAVPQAMLAPGERAAYIAQHFWDSLAVGDTVRCRNREFVERNFVNFLSLFPHTKPQALASGLDRMWERAVGDTASLHLMTEIAEHYLASPNSPMRNEDYFIMVLESLLRHPNLPEVERERPAYQLATACKNRRGSTATDFKYVDRNGRRSSLHATSGQRLLLLFYDPACSHCEDILDGLRSNELIHTRIVQDELRVLAVYTEGDRRLWDSTKASMPQEWSVGYDMSGIVERNLYNLPAMPVIYLLDADKRVILKDPTPEELLQAL